MTDFADTLIRPEARSEDETDNLFDAVTEALSTGELVLGEVQGLDSDQLSYVTERIKTFSRQCELLSRAGFDTHPCAVIGDDCVPIEFLPRADVRTNFAAADIRNLVLAAGERGGLKLETRMLATDDVKRSFVERVASFIRRIIGTPTQASLSDDDTGTRRLKVTVNCHSRGLQVVYSEYFMVPDEIAFGLTLSTPVEGYLSGSGHYYFGTVNRANAVNWSRVIFDIPPSFVVNLPH